MRYHVLYSTAYPDESTSVTTDHTSDWTSDPTVVIEGE